MQLFHLSAIISVIPTAYKHRLVCFSDTNPRVNLDLSCRSRGVINVLHTRQGWRETSAEGGMCKRPDDMSSDLCLVHVQDDAMLDACSGKEACNVSVARTSLRACAHNASFLFVEYQCIQGQCLLTYSLLKKDCYRPPPCSNGPSFVFLCHTL